MQVSCGVDTLKYRKKRLYEELCGHLGSTFREFDMQRESQVIERRLLPDHVHVLISIQAKYAAAQVGGLSERQKCNAHRRSVNGSDEELYGPAGVFCVDRCSGCGNHPRAYPTTAAVRLFFGTDENL